MAEYTLREATENDSDNLYNLIKGIAEMEKMSDQVKLTAEQLRIDGFGPDPLFKCILAEVTNETETILVGYALYYFTYSSFQGRVMYLEDIFVLPDFRKYGIGSALWKKVAQVAVEKGCCRNDFVVLDWNKNAIDFYEKRGAVNLTQKEGWYLFRLPGSELKNMGS